MSVTSESYHLNSYLHSYSCSSHDPGPIAKEYSEVSIPGAQQLPPSSLAQMSTQAPKFEELELIAGTASPRLRTDRRTLTLNMVSLCEDWAGPYAFYSEAEKDNARNKFLRIILSDIKQKSVYSTVNVL